MNPYDQALALLVTDETFLDGLDYHFGPDRQALLSYVGALSTKTVMMALCGRWADEQAGRLKDLLCSWSRRYLRRLVPGEAYGYGALQVTLERRGEGMFIRAEVTSVTGDHASGGVIRVRAGGCQATRDYDDQTSHLACELIVAPADEPLAAEVLFYGYDPAFTDGRLHRGVVQAWSGLVPEGP